MSDSCKNSLSDIHEPIAFDCSPRFAENGEPLLDNWDAAEYAGEDFLFRGEVIAILQGLQPRYRRGRPTCLDKHWSDVQRLRNDIRHRHIPMPCRPRELVHWANAHSIALPEAFVNHVPDPNADPLQLPDTVNPPQRDRIQSPANAKPPQSNAAPPPIKLSPRQQSRRDCQVIAIRIWTEKPRISKEKMLMEREIAAYTNSYAVDTVRKWLSQVDPRSPESKPGPRRKRSRLG